MAEKLKSNNIEFDASKVATTGAAAPNMNLIEQYKQKLSKAQKELDQKLKEIQAKDKSILDLKQAQSRNDKILKKHMDENKALKKGGASASNSQVAAKVSETLPQKRDLKAMRANKKANAEKNIEDFNAKFLTDLQG